MISNNNNDNDNNNDIIIIIIIICHKFGLDRPNTLFKGLIYFQILIISQNNSESNNIPAKFDTGHPVVFILTNSILNFFIRHNSFIVYIKR